MVNVPFTSFAFAPTGAPSAYAITMPTRLSRDSVNVKDFGAIGDGVHDDSDNLQAAIDYAFGPYLAPHGLTDTFANVGLYFPAGKYIITKMLHVRSLAGGRIHGAGAGATQIVYRGPIASSDGGTNSAKTIMFRTNGYSRVIFENIEFKMTGYGKTIPTPFANLYTDATVCFDWNWDDSLGNTTTCIWLNCKFSGATYGFTVGREYLDLPQGTSTTPVLIGKVGTSTSTLNSAENAALSLQTQSGLSAYFPTGAHIEISHPGNVIMHGIVVSYSGTTLVLDTRASSGGIISGESQPGGSPANWTGWDIWEARKTFFTQPGLDAYFLIDSHISAFTNDLVYINAFSGLRVISYDNVTGKLVLNISRWAAGGYYDADGANFPTSNGGTYSSWVFRHYWGFECDGSQWISCVFEDCYFGVVHSNQNVINCQFAGGACRRCLGNGMYFTGGICQLLVGMVFEGNGCKVDVLGGAFGDDGYFETFPSNYNDIIWNPGAPTVLLGCNTTSKNFIGGSTGGMMLLGCRRTYNGSGGIFYRAGPPAGNQLEGCRSVNSSGVANGTIAGYNGPSIIISDSVFDFDFTGGSLEIHDFVKSTPFHFAQLPSSVWLAQGLIVSIDDSTVNGWSNPVTVGSGSLSASIQWNGANWTVIGK